MFCNLFFSKQSGSGLLLLLAISAALAQNSEEIEADKLFERGDSLFYSNEKRQAIDYYERATRIYRKEKIYHSIHAEAYQKMGNSWEVLGKYREALDAYRMALSVQYKGNMQNAALFTSYLYLGNAHYYLQRYDSAEYCYTKAEHMLDTSHSNNEQIRLYNSIGTLYHLLGDYEKAVTYLEKATSLLSGAHENYLRASVRLTLNIAQIYTKLQEYTKAIVLYEGIMDDAFDQKSIYQSLGDIYRVQGQYDSAKHYLQRGLDNEYVLKKIAAHNELADVYLQQGSYDSSRLYFEISIALNKMDFNSKNTYLAESYTGLAQVKTFQNDLDSALYYYQLALINTTFDYNDSTVTLNPNDVTQAISLLHLFSVLQGKAAAWNQYYQQDHDTTKLTHALKTYQLAIRVAQHIQKTYDNDEAKLFLVNKVAPVYEEAIATAVQLYELTQDPTYVAQAFQFSENSKASVLAESLRDVKIKASGTVNDSLLQEEQRVKQQITALRLKLVESQDSTQNERYRQQLNDLEISLARTIKYLQQDEHYYQRKYQPDTLDIAALQRSLVSDDEVLLEYFVGQDQLYLFLLNSNELQVTSLARTAQLDSALQRTRRQLYAFQPGQGSDEASLATLYRYLIAPVAETVAEAHQLTIIADGLLHYLPFDLLSVDGRPANYLLQTHTVHYGYSASLLQQAVNERRGFPTEAVLAMAPFAGEATGNVRSGGFDLLRDSQTEVKNVGGSIYIEGDATKRQFLKVAGSYNVLHLATHATINSEDPSESFIAFYPNQRDSVSNYRLYTHELYNMRLDSVKLVVLSACEAGSGQLVRGEGVMSLARAFAYAGCPNIVTTLWKADDWAAARLTSGMHRYLKEGWTKDEALRQAKLDYLADERVQPAQKAPYYWANFVFIGDPVPIYDDYRLWWWVGIVLLLLTITGLLIMRRKQRTKEVA